MDRILAIESDPGRVAMLRHLMPSRRRADLQIVRSVDAAIASINKQIPDLVLTSTFLAPSDEAALTEHLKHLPTSRHVQVIIVPHFIDSSEEAKPRTNVFRFLRSRSSEPRPTCDPSTVREQIENYLERALMLTGEQVSPAPALEVLDRPAVKPEMRLIHCASDLTSVTKNMPARDLHLGRAHAADRRRSQRRASGELPGLWAVKLPGVAEVRVVDISTRGLLVETTSKLSPGSMMDFQVVGQDTSLCVPGRVLRSDVSEVDARGVKYRVAAAFARDLDLLGFGSQPASPALTPTALADVFSRVLSEADRSGPAAVRRFEHELRQLLPVRDIQLRQGPLTPSGDAESIYFTVPAGAGPQPVLQAIFEPDYELSPMEFKVLKAAATLAAALIDLTPAYDMPASALRAAAR